MKRHTFEFVTVASREGERLYLGHNFRFFQCFSQTPLVANASYARIGRFAIGLVLKSASVVWLAKGIHTYWGSGRLAPRSPPSWPALFRLARGVFFCVLFGSFSLIGVVPGFGQTLRKSCG